MLLAGPVRGAHQGQGRKKEQAQPNAFGTHWECACRGAGKRATGHTPARQEAEREPGAKSPYKCTRVRGGGASLTNPHGLQRGWRGERSLLSVDSCMAVVALEMNSYKHGRCLYALGPHCPDIPGLIFNTTMLKHSKSDSAHMAGDNCLPSKKSE